MLLAIDEGNSRTKMGVFAGGALESVAAVETNAGATAAELRALVASVAGVAGAARVAVCSVLPEQRARWREALEGWAGEVTILTGSSPTPLRNAYRTQETLGPDRLMAAVGAAARGLPAVVAMLGTATVVDVVDAEGTYRGGAIAPGVGPCSDALRYAAPALPEARWRPAESAVADTSAGAVEAGFFHFVVGGIRALVQAALAEAGDGARIYVTGGWAEKVAPHLGTEVEVVPHLVLEGIRATAGDG